MPRFPRWSSSSSSVASGLSIAGRWRRKKGIDDELARRIADLVNSDSEIKSATMGGDAVWDIMSDWGTSAESESGSGGFWICSAPDMVRNRNKTPSSSRTYLGPVFFFSALHWPMTRIRRLRVEDVVVVDDESSSGGGGWVIEGSHHHPSKSIPPSSLPPTRLRDMDMVLCSRASDLSSKALP